MNEFRPAAPAAGPEGQDSAGNADVEGGVTQDHGDPSGPARPGRVDPAVLARLLAKLKVTVQADELARADARSAAVLPPPGPAEQVRHLLAQVSLRHVQAVQLLWRRLDLRRLPALVWHDGRWWMAERASTGAVALTDGEGQSREAEPESLQDALVVWLRTRPAQGAPVPLLGNRAARLVWQELFREPGWLGKVMVATLLVNVLALSSSLFGMQVYDRVVPTLAYATLTTLVAGMALVMALDWVLKTVRARILDSVACQVDKRVSQRVFEHLLHLQLDRQPRSLGSLAAQVSGLDAVRQFLSSSIVFGLIDMPFALLFVGMMWVLAAPVAWVYLAVMPVALALGLFVQGRLRRLLRQQLSRGTERQGLLVDAIRGAESIRASNAGWRFAGEWQAITASIDAANIQQKAVSHFATVTTQLLSSVAYVAGIVVGVWQIEAGQLSMGGLIACGMLGGRVIAPLAQCVQYLIQWQHVTQALQMVDPLLGLELERRPGQGLLLPEEAPRSAEVERVRFAYPESPMRQLDVESLTFTAGERVLLVGPVGCGKSTLLKVLAGLYRPSEGRVRLGDADLWEIDPQVVAGHVGYLPQAVHLFKGSLRSNLALAAAGGDSRLSQIARELGVDAIAAGNPLGMDLPIAEGGEGLSGGQRQLVALARVAISQPRLWLLDEPTASLDAESEARVWQALAAHVRPDDILIVATHRPMPALKLATRVVLMREGKVVKDGSPDAVLPQMLARPAAARAGAPAMQAGRTLNVV
ncbi:ATP-binding cassette domain-containing protein [Aquabacterium sp. A7-Y]|uniref:ATP-binding cassette domain-containing protein n=1 Tax=Aquabacterium sp. A7-Y TaxID=1349605 RepID=UPI00223E59E3|nr:ATP-binding cassette domain-containing protein [Aquabacterium sp. A7-Y]MCW7541885.1 ATP-binding cassette domain-containing protein [Aquabacterium sp. A7-Y]